MRPALLPEQEIQLGFYKPPVFPKFKGRHTPVLDVSIESPGSHFQVAAGLGGRENLIARSLRHHGSRFKQYRVDKNRGFVNSLQSTGCHWLPVMYAIHYEASHPACQRPYDNSLDTSPAKGLRAFVDGGAGR